MKKFAILVLAFCVSPIFAEVRLPALVGNNMVLQRDQKVRIWGWASADEEVTVEFNGQTQKTKTDKDGNWSVFLKSMKAGGPYDMIITGQNKITLKNILIGEVWVASGQSNMEWSVNCSADAAKEIADANYPNIRLFTVNKQPVANPVNNVAGEWLPCTPQTIPNFSAVAYFFGRELLNNINVPIGLINTSWGGTNAQTWASKESLDSNPKLAHYSKIVDQRAASREEAIKAFQKNLAEWQKASGHEDPGNVGVTKGWADPKFNAADWKTMDLPAAFDRIEGNTDFDGVIWFRKEVQVPSEWAGKDLELHLGVIDDFDTTYFNGKQVGCTGSETVSSWCFMRVYKIPGECVVAGKNVIAIRVVDIFMNGTVNGPASEMFLTSLQVPNACSVHLTGAWQYKIEHKMAPKKTVLSKPTEAGMAGEVNQPTSLYNGMIHPLTPYTIRGAIWYQGESNVGSEIEYRTLFPTMIEGWRKAWGQGDFPFYYVQVAIYLPAVPDPVQEGWAGLREAQTMTLKTSNTGMAVTIDIGDAGNIHPSNKQDVGKRLALWALAKTYGQKKLVYSGPLYKSMKVKGNKIRIKFDHVGSGLIVKGDKLTGFAIAGADKKFVHAEAKIEGDKVFVWSDKVEKPVAVRYGWANNPSCNLYNKEGLPASPFRTDME